jgi:hypothetical protein
MAVDLDRTQLERAGRELIVPGMKNQLYDEMPLLKLFISNNQETAKGTALIHPVPLFRTVATGIVGGYGTMVTQDQPLTINATLGWSQLYFANISISLDELDENSGAMGVERIISILQTKTEAAKTQLKENIYKHVHSNLTTDGRYNTIVGILAAAGSTTNTYAGIDRSVAANAGWKPNVFTTVVSDDEFLTPTDRSKYGPSVLRRQWLAAAHDKAPKIIVVTKNIYELLQFIGERNNLLLSGNTASLSFSKVTLPNSDAQQGVMEPPVFWDSYMPARHAYGLVPEDWKAWVFPGRNFDAIDLFGDGHIWQRGDKQVAGYMTIGFKGQMLCKVPRQQFVCTNLGS